MRLRPVPTPERVQGTCQEVDPAIVAGIEGLEKLWVRRNEAGWLYWVEVEGATGLSWIAAQTTKQDCSFPNLPYPVPEWRWDRVSLGELLTEANGMVGRTPDGRALPCAGVLIDFERRVYVR